MNAIETRTTHPGVLKAMLEEQANPPPEQPIDEANAQEMDVAKVEEVKAVTPEGPELVIVEPLLDRICDAVAFWMKHPRAARRVRRRAYVRIIRLAPKFLRTVCSGLVSQEVKEERDDICLKCPDLKVALRVINGDSQAVVGHYCNGCDCGVWWAAELKRFKNWFRGHQCPKFRHSKISTSYRLVTIWEWIRKTEFGGRIPESLGRR